MDADSKRPEAWYANGKRHFQPGIGPFPETDALRLMVEGAAKRHGAPWDDAELEVPYPARGGRADLVFEHRGVPHWLEAKLYRPLRDNGTPESAAIKKIVSPFEADRSLISDGWKLNAAPKHAKRGLVVWSFDATAFPAADAMEAFRQVAPPFLARHGLTMGASAAATFHGLVHPVLRSGRVDVFFLEDNP